MTVYSRLGYNFDTKRFGGAATLGDGAKNTLNLIADNTPPMTDWQKTDLAAGPITRTNYFQNPMAGYCTTILASAQNMYESGNTTGDSAVMSAATALIISVNAFKKHTDNISGVTVVTSPGFPSYDTASSVGQMSMQTLTKTGETQTDTTPILGSFTSLFIGDLLSGNSAILTQYTSDYNASISCTTTGTGTNVDPYITTCTSNIDATPMITYTGSVKDIMDTRRTHDVNFYNNSIQIAQDNAFLQQFNTMGNTNTYLINNVVGTASLKAKLASQ